MPTKMAELATIVNPIRNEAFHLKTITRVTENYDYLSFLLCFCHKRALSQGERCGH